MEKAENGGRRVLLGTLSNGSLRLLVDLVRWSLSFSDEPRRVLVADLFLSLLDPLLSTSALASLVSRTSTFSLTPH